LGQASDDWGNDFFMIPAKGKDPMKSLKVIPRMFGLVDLENSLNETRNIRSFSICPTKAPHGHYRLSLRQWPKEARKKLEAVRVKIQIAGQAHEAMVSNGSERIVFDLQLPKGKTICIAWLYDEQGKAGGACFMGVELL
tara:strand:- start:32 stop:448 length:417 start_codon:yes stop_codon:yes gene_type:complete